MTSPPTDVVGIVAGSGALPRLIAEDRARRGLGRFVCAFEGAAPEWIRRHPHAVLPFEKPGALFRALREAGADAVVFAGGMTRPRLNPLRFDATAARLAPTLLPMLKGGDDRLLRTLAGVFEREGFRVLAPHALLEGLLAPAGAFSAATPEAEALRDVARAAQIVRGLGALDLGQGAVVAAGLCLGIETIQGTDAMLDFVSRTRGGRADVPPRGGVLFKGTKPGQDRRLDLPALGSATARAAAAAGLSGIAVEAEGALLIDARALREEADRLGLFLYGWRGA